MAWSCLCLRGEGGEPCRSCPSCFKLAAGSHPDLIVLEPEAGKKKIAIEQARELIKRLNYPPLEGDRRVVLIPDADRLSLEAANALLKTLEEPPADTLTLLTSSLREALPATVISRCQSFLFPRPEEDWLVGQVAGRMSLDQDSARLLAVLGQGDLETTCALDRESILKSRERFIENLCREPDRSGAGRLFRLAEEVSSEAASAELFLDLGAVCLRDLLVAAATGQADRAINRDLAGELAAAAQKGSPGVWADRLEAVLSARSALAAYANRRLTLEALMVRLAPEAWEGD